jgi:hypothetical protein
MASLTPSVDDRDADTLTQAISPSPSTQDVSPRKSRAFYLTFVAIMVATFLSALDLTAIGTALPTIANALNDTKGDYTWVWILFKSDELYLTFAGGLCVCA